MGYQSGANHDRRIGGIGTGSNGGDDNVTVVHGVFAIAQRKPCLQLIGFTIQLDELVDGAAQFTHWHPVLGAFWSGEVGFHCGHVELQCGGKVWCLVMFVAPHTLGLAVSFNQCDGLIAATR